MKAFRPLLVAFLLLAIAAPVAAVDETPTDPATPEAVPMLLAAPGDPAPCSDDIVKAINAGETPMVVEGCLLADGTLVPSNVMTIAQPMPLENSVVECSPEVAAAAGTENPVIAETPCLLPDGTLYELVAKDMSGCMDDGSGQTICADGTNPNPELVTATADDMSGEREHGRSDWGLALAGLAAGVALGFAIARRNSAAA